MVLLQMDPNLFHLDWDRTSEVMVAIILLSLLVERFLAVIFESRIFIDRLGDKHLKEPIAFLVSFLVCWYWDFDAVSTIILADETNLFGQILTGGIIAGGSKASVAMFRDFLGIKSTARKEHEANGGEEGEDEVEEDLPDDDDVADDTQPPPRKKAAKKTKKKKAGKKKARKKKSAKRGGA